MLARATVQYAAISPSNPAAPLFFYVIFFKKNFVKLFNTLFDLIKEKEKILPLYKASYLSLGL